MIRVLYVCNFESPYRIEFWNELTQFCDVTVLFTETKEQQGERDSRWFSNLKYKFKTDILKQTKLLGGKYVCFGVRNYIKSRSYDLIIFHPYSPLSCVYGICYCIRHHIRYVINSDGGFAKSGKGLHEKLKRYLISHAFAFTSTAELTDEYLAFYGGNRDRMFRYTLTTVREKDIAKSPVSDEEKKNLRVRHNILEDKVVITVGNMIPRKGFDLLLKSARSINSDIGIYIIGGKPTESYLHFCEENHLANVHFMDFMDKAMLYEYYRASDLFVLPTREDIWGLVVIEAMACGLPVITTDRCIAGCELIENGKNGFLYPVNDTEQLGYLINTTVNNANTLKQMSQETVKRASNMSIEKMAKCHYDIFREIVEQLNKGV